MGLGKKSRIEDKIVTEDNAFIYFDKQASLLAASAKDAEVSELQRKPKLADNEIDRINKRFDEAQGMLCKRPLTSLYYNANSGFKLMCCLCI